MGVFWLEIMPMPTFEVTGHREEDNQTYDTTGNETVYSEIQDGPRFLRDAFFAANPNP